MERIEQIDPRKYEFQKEILSHSRLILEVGPGLNPLLPTKSELKRHPDELYIGWNIDMNQHRYLSKIIFGRKSEYSKALYADLEGPNSIDQWIPSDSVDRLIMANVLGEHPEPIHYADVKEFNPDGKSYKGATESDDKYQLLTLAPNLLKPGGELIVVETMTPTFALDKSQPDLPPIALTLLDEIVLNLTLYEKGDNKDFTKILRAIHPGISFARKPHQRSFVIIASKI